jgi:hypothetical protein
MACPYFYPLSARAQRDDSQSTMLPLGDSWAGTCLASPEQPWQPKEAALRPLCNLGYARGTCGHFPAGDGPDAVRFAISASDGAAIRLYFVVERDHHPFAHGPLEYSLATRAFAQPPASETMLRQAHAYVESFLRRKSEETGR